jgi:Flp pilus assembly protein TadD
MRVLPVQPEPPDALTAASDAGFYGAVRRRRDRGLAVRHGTTAFDRPYRKNRPSDMPFSKRVRSCVSVLVAAVLAGAPVAAQTTAVRDAERLVASGDFTGAAGLLRAHLGRQPDDLEAVRLLARELYWAGDVAGARAEYERALRRNRNDRYLRLDFARMLMETGDRRRARALLVPLLDASDVSADARTLLGTVHYWEGDFTSAVRWFDAALSANPTQADARRQLREIQLLTAPWVRLAPAVWHDDQPLDWQGATVEGGWFAAPLTSVRASVQLRRYSAARPTITMWQSEADLRHYVPHARLDLEVAGGAVQRTVNGTASTAWTGRGAAGVRLPHRMTVRARLERRPYLYTISSLETSVMIDAAAAELHLNHPRGWLGQAAIERQRYPDDNTLRTAYAWLLAPLARTAGGHLQAGYSFTTEDTAQSRFVPAGGSSSLAGMYTPYYTPARVVKHAAIGATALTVAPRATLRVGGSVAIRAEEDAPSLVPTTTGIARVFGRRTFNSWDARVSFDVAAGDRALITLAGETGRSAYYQWARAGLDVPWRFASGTGRQPGAR